MPSTLSPVRTGQVFEGPFRAAYLRDILPYLGAFNVKDYGAKGIGTDDTIAIDAAYAALNATTTGGVLYFPAGSYIYSGVGIFHNPGATTYKPMAIRGAGQGLTSINFASCSNAQCIYIGSQAVVGSGYDMGGGVSDLSLILPSGKNGIVIASLERALVQNVGIQNGATALTMTDDRTCLVENFYATNWTGDGILVNGELHSESRFAHIAVAGANGAGYGFDWVKTTNAGYTGITLVDVGVNGITITGGMRFQGPTGGNFAMFVFLDSVIVDGQFTQSAYTFKDINNVIVTNIWAYNGAAGGGGGVSFNNAKHISMSGGEVGAVNGADFQLNNACDNITSVNVSPIGPFAGWSSDGTTHTRINVYGATALSAANHVFNASTIQSDAQGRSHAYHTGTQTITTSTWTSIAYTVNEYDFGPIHSTSVNNTRFTAPVPGEYSFQCADSFAGSAAGQRYMRVLKNGTAIIWVGPTNNPGVAVTCGMNMSGTATLAAGDYIEFQVYQDSGGNLNLVTATSTSQNNGASVTAIKVW